MKTIQIPYDTSHLEVHVDENRLIDEVYAELHDMQPPKSEKQIVIDALNAPTGSRPLAELARECNKVLIVTSDHTRSMPSRVTLPLLLREVRRHNPNVDVTILIATGLHRPTTIEEQREMFGDEIVEREHIVVHDAFADEDMRYVCQLPSGAAFSVNRLAKECDLLVSEGFIEPHFFAGFSGGRKSILPGISARDSINTNHSFPAIASEYAVAGELERNPIHKDMLVAARAVGVDFILNVALNGEKKIVAAFAGDVALAHDEGVDFVRHHSQYAAKKGDIVITGNGGYPLDQNLYQAPKAAATAEACAKEDGVIILCASCCDGLGGRHFAELMTSGTIEEIEERLARIAPAETIPEMWCVQIFCRILKKHPVIVVTDRLDHGILLQANLLAAFTPDQALAMAYEMRGEDADVLVIPDGVSVLAAPAD